MNQGIFGFPGAAQSSALRWRRDSFYASGGTFVVPPGCFTLRAYVRGSCSAGDGGGGAGGTGGRGSGNIPVTPGQRITITGGGSGATASVGSFITCGASAGGNNGGSQGSVAFSPSVLNQRNYTSLTNREASTFDGTPHEVNINNVFGSAHEVATVVFLEYMEQV